MSTVATRSVARLVVGWWLSSGPSHAVAAGGNAGRWWDVQALAVVGGVGAELGSRVYTAFACSVCGARSRGTGDAAAMDADLLQVLPWCSKERSMASLVSDCRGQVRPGRRERCGAVCACSRCMAACSRPGAMRRACRRVDSGWRAQRGRSGLCSMRVVARDPRGVGAVRLASFVNGARTLRCKRRFRSGWRS